MFLETLQLEANWNSWSPLVEGLLESLLIGNPCQKVEGGLESINRCFYLGVSINLLKMPHSTNLCRSISIKST